MRELAPGRAGNTRAPSRSPRGTSGLHGPRWAGTAQLQPLWSLRGVAGEAMLETPRMGRRAFKSCAAGTRAQSACVVPPNVSAQLCLQKPSATLHGLSLQDPKLRLVDNFQIRKATPSQVLGARCTWGKSLLNAGVNT